MSECRTQNQLERWRSATHRKTGGTTAFRRYHSHPTPGTTERRTGARKFLGESSASKKNLLDASTMVRPTLLWLFAAPAEAYPSYWLTRFEGGCGRLVSDRRGNTGMGSGGYSLTTASSAPTASGSTWQIPVPSSSSFFVTAEAGSLSGSDYRCSRFRSAGGGTAVYWTPPAGASGTYNIEVGYASYYYGATIYYYSVSVTVGPSHSHYPVSPEPEPEPHNHYPHSHNPHTHVPHKRVVNPPDPCGTWVVRE